MASGNETYPLSLIHIYSLIIEGILAGVGSVLSFLPPILMLFFFLSILEDTGYMARVAFVMDRLLRKIGLSGHSLIPMLIGFGCSVPAIMSARTLYSDSDRKISIFLVPFMSCGAKLPILSLIHIFRSLYLDNYRDKALLEKLDGVNRREKFRVRCYNGDYSFLRLEKKRKENGLCQKSSVEVGRKYVEALLLGQIPKPDRGHPLLWELYIKQKEQQLMPRDVYKRQP